MNQVNVKCEPVSSFSQGNDDTFINKLLDEMKNQFNKTEETGSEEEDTKITQLESNQQEVDEPGDEKDDKECEASNNLMMFKKPNDESLIKKEDISPGKRSSRQKRGPLEDIVEGTVKRSSRRRSRNNKESVLQSAIARKEKSYNESNKPQRLTRQLKPTPKILENIVSAKDKNKIKTQKSSDTDGQNNNVDLIRKKSKNVKNSKKNVKKIIQNNESDMETDSDESLSEDNELTMEIMKNTRRSQRISSSQKIDEIEDISGRNSSVNEQENYIPNDSTSSLAEQELIASRLCLCTEKTKMFAEISGEEVIFCNAIDSIQDKLIGCSRVADVRHTCLLRPSQRIPYQVFCDLHKNRLIRHNCCPTCGIFCTQGRFVECESKHHYHNNCHLAVGTLICCPHCGTSKPGRIIEIELHSSKKPVILPVQKVK